MNYFNLEFLRLIKSVGKLFKKKYLILKYFIVWNLKGNINYLTGELLNPQKISLQGKVRIESKVSLKCHNNGRIFIGSNSILESYSIIESLNGEIQFGSNSTLNQYSIIRAYGNCVIGDGVRIGPNVLIMAMKHNFENPDEPIFKQGISGTGVEIGNNVWIGGSATILDGVKIGDNCIVGAGTVVTKNIATNSVVVGNPGRIIRNLY